MIVWAKSLKPGTRQPVWQASIAEVTTGFWYTKRQALEELVLLLAGTCVKQQLVPGGSDERSV